ncbi:RNA polymerase II transcription factor B subunit 1 [Microbotryomycetes sp. JL201]|nr:RNA polymerase II transcription factor B subunit 1 [Microbotryomycetes sp. JL201]
MAPPAQASSSTSQKGLCQAQVAYKKQPGTLELFKDRLVFSSAGQPQPLTIDNDRMTTMFASKDGAAKVALKIALRPRTATSVGDESYNFQFTAGSSAVSDRERFKKELSAIINSNRERALAEPLVAAATYQTDEDVKPTVDQLSAVDKSKQKASAPVPQAKSGNLTRSASPTTQRASRAASTTHGAQTLSAAAATTSTSDIQLRRLVLQADPPLKQLYTDLVIGRQISDTEFWEGREDLLEAARAVENQMRGKSGAMVDLRPETDEKGDVTVKITPQLIADIFAEYPMVLRAYNENVPDPLDEQQFWTRYFQSKLFNRNRTANRAAVANVKDDPIFDRYLGEEDDDIEPKNLKSHDIYRLLDLAATEEDQHEVVNRGDLTMRPGRERGALPLIRRFNEHSERLLNQSLGRTLHSGQINPGNAGDRDYFNDILLDDLVDTSVSDRIRLELQPDKVRTAFGADVHDQNDLLARLDREKVVYETQATIENWQPRLNETMMTKRAIDHGVQDMIKVVKQKVDRTSKESGIGGGISKTTLQSSYQVAATSNEFLRLFWQTVLPPKPNDISALALAPPKERAARAERYKGCLDNSLVRINTVLDGGGGSNAQRTKEEQSRIEAALQPVKEAVEHAIEFYKTRTT